MGAWDGSRRPSSGSCAGADPAGAAPGADGAPGKRGPVPGAGGNGLRRDPNRGRLGADPLRQSGGREDLRLSVRRDDRRAAFAARSELDVAGGPRPGRGPGTVAPGAGRTDGAHASGREIPLDVSIGLMPRDRRRLLTFIARDATESRRAERACGSRKSVSGRSSTTRRSFSSPSTARASSRTWPEAVSRPSACGPVKPWPQRVRAVRGFAAGPRGAAARARRRGVPGDLRAEGPDLRGGVAPRRDPAGS